MSRSNRKGKVFRANDIYDSLVLRISSNDFPVGEYLPSERTLIAEFGVSRPTLRKALQRLERQGYLTCHPGVGYEVRRAERRAAGDGSKLVGVLWDSAGDVRLDRYLPKIESELSANGYAMLLAFTDRELSAENKRIAGFMETGVAGLIALPSLKGTGPSKLAELVGESFPIMALGEPSNWVMSKRAWASCSFVGVDNAFGVRNALGQLHDLGHRRIGHSRWRNHPPMTIREKTYREWMEEKGQAGHDAWIVSGKAEGGPPVEQLSKVAAGTEHGPTAFLCETVDDAAQLGEALQQLELDVPGDVSVAAFRSDDGPDPKIQGKDLGGLCFSWDDFAREAVAGLVTQIHNPALQRRTLIRPDFEMGETIAAPVACASSQREK